MQKLQQLLRSTILLGAALTMGFGAIPAQAAQSPQSPNTQTIPAQQNIVIHLTHYTDDLQAAFMALGLANKIQEQGHHVTLLLSLRGVMLANKSQPHNHALLTDEPSLDKLYAMFIKAGGEVIVCPHCSKMIGLASDELMEGAQLSAQGEFTEALLRADKVITY